MQLYNPNDRFTLTPCQKLLWRSQSASPSCPMFNQVITVNLKATGTPVRDAKRWAQAWTKTQRTHPVLTARIDTTAENDAHQWPSDDLTVLDIVQLPLDQGVSTDVFEHWIEQRKVRVNAPGSAMTDAAYVYSGDMAIIYLNLHHLISDAWSTVIIWQALEAHYNVLHQAEFTSGIESHSINNAVSFFDYLSKTNWSEGHEAKEAVSQHTAQERAPATFYQHSNSEPDTCSTRVALPMTDVERQQLTTLHIGDNENRLSATLHQMALHLTAFAIYLHRASGDQNIVIEVPLLGRFGKQWLDVAGNFIEMMQISIAVNSDDSIVQIYHKANDALFSILKQANPGCTANLPSRSVHGVLNIITASNNPQASTTHNANDGQITWHHTGHSDMRHPLRLHVADWNASGTPILELDINHGFFKPVQRARLPWHLAALYKAMLYGNSDQRVSTIALTSPSELWCLTGTAQKQASNSLSDSLYQRIHDIAHQHPDAIALTEGDHEINYAELVKRSQNVGHKLQRHGIGRGHRVVVFMHRGLELPIVLLGILACGATYIPIDAYQPPARVDAILASAEIDALVIDRPELEYAAPITFLSSALIDVAHNSQPSYELTEPSPDDTAYIMYTSGSTGVPKGVVVSHRALMSYLGWAQDYYRLPEAINMPLFTSVGFDLTVTSLFLPWLTGGTLHVYPQSHQADALALFDVMQNAAINTVKLTPAHLALLLESDCRIASVMQLIVGGEDFKNSTAAAVQSRTNHPLKIVNEYGPTEAAVGCIFRVWSSPDDTGSVPIGIPISGMSAYLLDEHGMPPFEGTTGELFLAGSSLADGYWKEPALTDSAFITTSAVPGKRLYRTGDLARIDNGELLYLGRKDTQVNVKGYRIELSDIESAVMEHPAVSHCIVRLKNEQQVRLCNKCGLSSLSPDASIDESGTCTLCQSYSLNEKRITSYFRSPDDLRVLVRDIKSKRRGKHDAVVLLSGGKDSTYALCQLVDLGLSVYAFSLDNGYLSDHALANIDTVCERLGVDHYFARTEHMDAIFNDSLTRYSNVCHGCFKTIYNLAMAFAAEHQIDTIFTGLSRGQLFETRLNNELFSDKTIPITHIDNMVVAARIQYHAIKDAPNTLLDIQAVNNGSLPKAVDIVDFYRYWHVEMADMLAYLESRINWVRPPDTGRSTNCLINDVGIHVHKLEQGFHNYALPYSWDVRLGHKEREEALEELDDDIDNNRVKTILEKINYTVRTKPSDADNTNNVDRIEGLFTTITPTEPSTVQRWLQEKLPAYMQPSVLTEVAQLPLNLHGKVDRERAFDQNITVPANIDARVTAPLSASETQVAKIWEPYIASSIRHRDDNFFQLGGDSQAAIRCVMELRRQGYDIEPADLFKKPVLFRFAEFIDNSRRISASKPVTPTGKFSRLSESQRDKLSRLLQHKSNNNVAKDT